VYPWQGDAVNNLNPAQVEQLKEIGAQLRQLRQEQSISTEEVAAKTFISSRLLTALEEGKSDQLPEPVFIQGFIRRYADVLDLDGHALAKTFPTNLLPPEVETSTQETVPEVPSKVIGLYALYILIMVAAVSGLFYLVNRPQTAQPVIPKKTTPIVQQPKPVANAVPSTLAPGKVDVPIQVAITLTDESWMKVIADGKTEFEGTLSKGTQKTWTAKKELTLTAGNAGAVLISSNRHKEKLLGKPQEVKDITFTPEQ
jgi:cytoskeletal protein RodZ